MSLVKPLIPGMGKTAIGSLVFTNNNDITIFEKGVAQCVNES
jgi:hypothetical protein